MHVLVIIDNRERALLALWKGLKDIPYEIASAPLNVGDIWICKSSNPPYIPKESLLFGFNQKGREEQPFPPENPDIVIERKTQADLNSSIKDGRYGEQKRRLLDCNAAHVVMMMEGFASPKDTVQKKRELSIFTNSVFRDEFQVYHTANAHASFEWIDHTCRQMQKGKFEDSERQKKRGKYSNVVKMEKKANLTPQNILEVQLGQVPGVSAKMGQIIAQRYPTMSELCQAFMWSDNPRKLLVDIEIDGKRLGIRGEKIYNYLFGLQ